MKHTLPFVLGALVALTGRAPAATIDFTVDDPGEAADMTPGDGACQTSGGTCTLRAALQEASALPATDRYVVHLPANTYTVSTTLPDITRDVTIEGTDPATCNIRSSDAGRPGLFDALSGSHLTLDHVTVSNAGDAAIRLNSAAGTITNSVVTGNAAVGISAANGATVVLTDDTIADNATAATGAGGINVSYSNLTATNVVFSNNSGGYGGAVYINGYSYNMQSFTGCTFTGNSSGSSGGAMAILAGTVAIDACTFDGNTAMYTGGAGGAIYADGRATTVTNSTFTNNRADSVTGGEGGAIFVYSVVRAINCTFSGNESTNGHGGAVFAELNPWAKFDAIDCTFAGNHAAGGGALGASAAGGTLDLRNVTIAGNSATDTVANGFGGGGTWGFMQSRNSIVAGNVSAGGGADCVGTFSSQGYNLIGDGGDCALSVATGDLVGTTASPIDPHLGPLQNNGGPTDTMALLAPSPAGDAADPGGCTDDNGAAILTDQRGQPRVVDGNGDGTPRCDMGAYEAPAGIFPTTSTSTTSTSTTSTTIPPLCVGGTTVSKASLRLKRNGGGQIVLTGILDFPAAAPDRFDPAATGAQVKIEDLGNGAVAVFDLSHFTQPVPAGAPGTGCGASDGWRRTFYKNTSNELPPSCTRGSAGGLKRLALKDRRRKGHGIGMAMKISGISVATPLVGPFRATIVLGADVSDGLAGACAVHTFEPSVCRRKRRSIACG